jgi:16S rRNA (adenine1518-N6/adenine1519-N6)-dimethyltransferase
MARPTATPPPLKRLGQHFLIDPNVIRKIVTLADLHDDEVVLEIGPGRGDLTRALCAAARSVIAVELDRKLAAYLMEQLGDCRNLDLRVGDALAFPFETLPRGTVVVANLPYYVSTPLLFRLLAARDRITRMVLMLQAEVARRLVAQPGDREYGILSVLAQSAAELSLAFRVSPHCFRPRPDVGSAVVRIMKQEPRRLRVTDEALFARIVRAAFAHRRKTLVNSLRDEGLDPDTVAHALESAGIHPTRRAETLGIEEFASLTDAISCLSGHSPRS